MAHLFKSASFRVDNGNRFRLGDHATRLARKPSKKDLKRAVEEDRDRIAELQPDLYAERTRSLLLIFQAMDAAGKDSCIAHLLSGVNPQGCSVWSFKAPNAEELDHDFLWRHAKSLPARGMIGVHNRSHYEEVLVVRVHPEFLMGQRIPGIATPKDADKAFWEARYTSIRDFEAHAVRQGMTIMKFHLHLSKKVQKERFLERIDDPTKNWKFNMGDVKERALWDRYTNAYEQAIRATATPQAPWFVVPANEQWESRAIVCRLVREQLEAMAPVPPAFSAKDRDELRVAAAALRAE